MMIVDDYVLRSTIEAEFRERIRALETRLAEAERYPDRTLILVIAECRKELDGGCALTAGWSLARRILEMCGAEEQP